MKLITLSGLKLAELIRKRKVSSLEVVDEHIKQIEKVNSTLNAVVANRFDVARQEAKKSKKNKVFGGVPCSIKECFALTGMPQSSGLYSRKDYRSPSDATAVHRLRNAGAIALGVTNTSELCMWMESNNKVYGRTSNPYDEDHIVGGSSGGEAAIIAAGGAAFGLGSDIGGSIRMPAFFNGIFGHKASSGLIPNSGQYPIAKGKASKYLTTGPLCRRAEDLMPLVQVLKGPDKLDAGCIKLNLGNEKKVKPVDLKILLIKDIRAPMVSAVKDYLQSKIEQAALALEARGAQVEEIHISAFKNSFDIWSSMLYEGNEEAFRTTMSDGKNVSFLWQLLLAIFGRSQFTIPGIILALVEESPKYMKKRTQRLIEKGEQLKFQLSELLTDNTVLFFPPYVSAAPKHNKPMFPPFNWVYTAIMNVMEFPVTQVPLGLNEDGLPLGVQVVGRHGNDHLTIGTALLLEKEFGGWIPPHRWIN